MGMEAKSSSAHSNFQQISNHILANRTTLYYNVFLIRFLIRGLPTASSCAYTPSSPKNYAAAFATPQSALGLGGQAPSVNSRKSRSKTASESSASAELIHSSLTEKSCYESAFGALSSQFGFGGIAPKSSSV